MPLYPTSELLSWIDELNKTVHVSIKKNCLSGSDFWFYDEVRGEIANKNRSFFTVKGLRKTVDGQAVLEQPVIVQDEIGYLGIICKDFSGETHYLMQAKIEPGNINKIQISPTIQATKSNFTQKHGGKRPAYLDWFINASKHKIIVDQIQSEQSSRFYKKRNRNIIIKIDEDIEVLPSHRWMTLGQIKELMRRDNLVNMDTRTVMSCLPIGEKEFLNQIKDITLYRSVIGESNALPKIYQYINNYKMFDEGGFELVRLDELKNWDFTDEGITCREPYSFKVIFCDIEIEGREVRRWTQPLFEATGIATFALLTRNNGGVMEFLVRATPEVGCFDKIELGPTVQREFVHKGEPNIVDKLFDENLKTGKGVKFDTLLSEEGGRFYCEQNRNIIMEIERDALSALPEGYFWVDYHTLSRLISVNNCLNIQLRNLLSVLEW